MWNSSQVTDRKSLAFLPPFDVCVFCCLNLWTKREKKGKELPLSSAALPAGLLIIKRNCGYSLRFLQIAPHRKLASSRRQGNTYENNDCPIKKF